MMRQNDTHFLRNDGWREWARDDHETDSRKGIPRMPAEKSFPHDAQMISLTNPSDFRIGDMPLREVIAKRRSRRQYTPDPISVDELSFLLWACQGVHRVPDHSLGSITFRTVPSGGSLHPFETYLCINRVDGVQPGLYRYLAIEHKLLFQRSSASLMDEVLAANCGNSFVKDCAVFLIWTAIPQRTAYQYSVVASKIIALDAWHMCQNIYLAGEALGLSVCAIDGYYQAEMDVLLGVDGEDELAIYAAAVGKIR